MDRKDFQELSRIRLREAKALLRLGLNDGAFYLAGYAVECAIKACIARSMRRHEFPDKKRVQDSHSHNLGDLVVVARLEGARRVEARRDPEFDRNWDTVKDWSEQSRYLKRGAGARALIEAVAERNHGVVRWIRMHW